VIGNIWTVNSGTPAPAAITVPSSMASLRFWRSTSVAALATGATATLAPSSLGYEWDEDLDNGARPAASFISRLRRSMASRKSSTSVGRPASARRRTR